MAAADTAQDASQAAGRWLPVADVAAATGIPARTLYRWVRAGTIPARREGRATLVDPGAVEARRATRAAGRIPAAVSVVAIAPPPSPPSTPATPAPPLPASTAPVPAPAVFASAKDGNGVGTPATGEGDLHADGRGPGCVLGPAPAPAGAGELAAAAFAAFREGGGPIEAVTSLDLAPAVAEALWRDYVRLADSAEADVQPTLGRVEALEQELAELRAHLGALRADLAALPPALGRVAAVEQAVAELPMPSRSGYTCPQCRSTGHPLVYLTCGACGAGGSWGFRPAPADEAPTAPPPTRP